MNPLVSCLCPTYNRREFISRSLQYFRQQDYPNLELIILDDGEDCVKDLIPCDSRIRYLYEVPRKNHGQKINRCMELANGEYGIVWDEDDYYSPDRITKQITPMLNDPKIVVTGTSRLYYYVHGTKQAYEYFNWTNKEWIGAIAFRKSIWKLHPFKEVPHGGDFSFIHEIPRLQWLDLKDRELVVCSIHGDNAAPKNTSSPSFSEESWETIEKITKGSL